MESLVLDNFLEDQISSSLTSKLSLNLQEITNPNLSTIGVNQVKPKRVKNVLTQKLTKEVMCENRK